MLVCGILAGVTAAAQEEPVEPREPEVVESEEPLAEPEGIAVAPEADPILDFHRPVYFVVDPETVEAKFRISIKARLLRHTMGEGKSRLWVHFGFTQTSFWDLGDESSPFRESDYNPELFATWRRRQEPRSGWRLFIAYGGLAHESNGRDGEASRSWNYAFVEPHLVFRRRGSTQDLLRLSARLWPITDVTQDNPDLLDFYGYGEFSAALGLGRFQARLTLRAGKRGDNGSALLNLAWQPLRQSTLQLLVQGWSGYGESLLDYNVRSSTVRVGLMIAR